MNKQALLGLMAAPLAGGFIGRQIAGGIVPGINDTVDLRNYMALKDPSTLKSINDLPVAISSNPRALKALGALAGAGLGGYAAYKGLKEDSPLLLPAVGAAGGAFTGSILGIGDTIDRGVNMVTRQRIPTISMLKHPMMSRVGKPAIGALLGGLGGYGLQKLIGG